MASVYDKAKAPITTLSALYDKEKNHPAHIYGKDKAEIILEQPQPIHSLSDVKWVAFGDSLTDPTAHGGPYKYPFWLNKLTGIDVQVAAVGGTGIWAGGGLNFPSRMPTIRTDADIVTIFGSVNDHKMQTGERIKPSGYACTMGTDLDGNIRTWDELYRPASKSVYYFSNSALVNPDTNPAILDELSYSDTLSDGDSTYVAYVNDCINIAHRRSPIAKIVLVGEIQYKNIHHDMCVMQRIIKRRLVEKRRSLGDTWLSWVDLFWDKYDGIYGKENEFCDMQPGWGLNFTQLYYDAFRAHYTADGAGHPTKHYNYEWLTLQFGRIICDALGISRDALPTEEQMVALAPTFPELAD